MKIKKAIAMILTPAMLLSLAACGSSSSEPEPAPAPAPAAESSAAAESSGGTSFSVTFTTRNGVTYDTEDCDLSALVPGNVVKGNVGLCLGKVATYSVGDQYVQSNKMSFYAVRVNGKWMLYGTFFGLNFDQLTEETDNYYKAFREDMTVEEVQAIIPTTVATVNGRVEKLPQELKDIFASAFGEGFETECVSNVYLVDQDYSN